MPSMAINVGNKRTKGVRTPPQHPSFLLGSRPGSLRAPPVPRIKPMPAERNYGKGGAQVDGLTTE